MNQEVTSASLRSDGDFAFFLYIGWRFYGGNLKKNRNFPLTILLGFCFAVLLFEYLNF